MVTLRDSYACGMRNYCQYIDAGVRAILCSIYVGRDCTIRNHSVIACYTHCTVTTSCIDTICDTFYKVIDAYSFVSGSLTSRYHQDISIDIYLYGSPNCLFFLFIILFDMKLLTCFTCLKYSTFVTISILKLISFTTFRSYTFRI